MNHSVPTPLDNAALDPGLQAFLAQAAAQNAPALRTLPLPLARQIIRDMAALALPAPAIGAVTDIQIDSPAAALPLRIYRPATPGIYPALLYVHGGGFVIGDLDSHDTVCRTLCHLSQRVVVAVQYRLAPEHPFPAAPDDVEAALRWLCGHSAPLQCLDQGIAVVGDSAGAQLALVATRRVRSTQVGALGLMYPMVQHPDSPSPSYSEHGNGKFLDMADIRWFVDCYLGKDTAAARHPDFALVGSDLRKLPATWLATMGYDPLRDEGHALALAMVRAGCAVTHRHYASAIHACIHFTALSPVGQQVLENLAQWLRQR